MAITDISRQICGISALPSSTPRPFYTRLANTTIRTRNQPARPARAADRREAENRSVIRRPCAARGWRCRHLPSPWGRLARGQCRACEPRPTTGDVSHRALPLPRLDAEAEAQGRVEARWGALSGPRAAEAGVSAGGSAAGRAGGALSGPRALAARRWSSSGRRSRRRS
jgi:hypothetical protein